MFIFVTLEFIKLCYNHPTPTATYFKLTILHLHVRIHWPHTHTTSPISYYPIIAFVSCVGPNRTNRQQIDGFYYILYFGVYRKSRYKIPVNIKSLKTVT